jgi:indole-3-glycerol phosphate synthase
MTEKNILEEIVRQKKEELLRQQKLLPQEKIVDTLPSLPPVKDVITRFQESIVTGQLVLIAEIKKASPSKGIIRSDFNPIEIALTYEKCGAQAISVLTDEVFFQGSLEYLRAVKNAVSLPVLRKDFIIDPYQVYQARYYGADFILLIDSILSVSQLSELEDLADSLGMRTLVETHEEQEFNFHIDRKTAIIGINNRNLKTFQTDINHTLELIRDKEICKSYVISESGISTFDDILKLSNSNITGVLIGETFMKEQNIEMAINKLFRRQALTDHMLSG